MSASDESVEVPVLFCRMVDMSPLVAASLVLTLRFLVAGFEDMMTEVLKNRDEVVIGKRTAEKLGGQY